MPEPESPPPYWEAPDWLAQMEKNVTTMAAGYDHDWGPYFDQIVERCGISRLEAMVFVISTKIHWWVDANVAFMKKQEGFLQQHMDEEHGDEDWKTPPEAP